MDLEWQDESWYTKTIYCEQSTWFIHDVYHAHKPFSLNRKDSALSLSRVSILKANKSNKWVYYDNGHPNEIVTTNRQDSHSKKLSKILSTNLFLNLNVSL